MKSAELVANRVYGYVSPSAYKSRDARDPIKSRRQDLIQGTLVDLKQYPYNKDYTSQYSASGLPAPVSPGHKGTWGVLLQRANGNFDIVRPVDIVGEWSGLDARWTKAEAEAKALAEAQAIVDKMNAEKDAEERRLLEKRSEYVTSQVKNLTTETIDLQFEVQGANDYRNRTRRVRSLVTLSLDDFNHLIERMFEEIESR